MAALCRNDLGVVIQVKTSVASGRNPLKGEARAAWLACQIAS